MAKKKRRYAKKRVKRFYTINPTCKDNHHILYMRRNWDFAELKELRQFHYCIIAIPKDTLHRFIHENLSGVPAPSRLAALEALNQLRMLDKREALHDTDSIEKRLTILIALFECVAQPTADALKEQLDLVHRFYNKPP